MQRAYEQAALAAAQGEIPVGAIIVSQNQIIGQGFNAPSLFAWASDTADNQHRGRALAMLFMFLELGIIVGGLTANYFIQGMSWNYVGIFGFSGLAFLMALGFSLYCLKANSK